MTSPYIQSKPPPNHPSSTHIPQQFAPVQSSPIDLTRRSIPTPHIPPYRTSLTPEPRRLDYYTSLESRVPSAPLPVYDTRIPIIHITPDNHHFGRTLDPKQSYVHASKVSSANVKAPEPHGSNSHYHNKPLLTSLLTKKEETKPAERKETHTSKREDRKIEHPPEKRSKTVEKPLPKNLPLEEVSRIEQKLIKKKSEYSLYCQYLKKKNRKSINSTINDK